jgi:hypothetical protein
MTTMGAMVSGVITNRLQRKKSLEFELVGAGLAGMARFKLSSISRLDCSGSIQACE